jgi:hypothetical protein
MSTTSRILIITVFVAVVGMATAFFWLDSQRSSEPSVNPPTVSESESVPRRYRPDPVSREAKESVDDILRRHRGMSKEELQRSPELNKFMNRFIAVLNTPELAAKIEERIAALPPGKAGEQGMIRMDLDMLDDARGRAWLEAAVSEDSQRMEDWVLNTLDGAIFEFALDPEMERTSEGVSLQRGAVVP